ncbi:DUF4998 domain-containing protein [uncultured Proteiniphilum sp.]|uniref:DUF4998 domain-containing protein n=1 Tax=uncultured Proteiniphilum sp. TaxID=497637 RepID=UPI0026305113|nr:DUF4998 domain-containing protein [uncultured Proteiniphilum sp.]
MKKQIIYLLWITSVVFSLSGFSCTGMYDTLREFATEEAIYPSGFDTIAGKIGFERVEIDLSTKGRIRASEMKLAKAKKTVIECSYFDSPLIIDSVCSWVNITGLIEPEEYTFKVFTEDEYGNRSIPKEISLIPYTSYDLEQMELLSPKITESSSTALIEWDNKLSGVLFDCHGYSYSYKDNNNILQTGGEQGDIPSFFVENITKGNIIPIEITLQITPKKNSVSIIDTVNWTSVISLNISESAGDVIFLKTPITAHTIDLNNTNDSEIYHFSWTTVENIDSYTLKISTSSNFPTDKTFELNVGNVSSIDLYSSQIKEVVANGSARCYWTIVPSSSNHTSSTQTRALNIYRQIPPIGMWLFDDVDDLFKAKIGQPLIEVSPGNKITLSNGPTENDKAVLVPELSYLTCRHGITPRSGSTYVNEYTILMNIKLSAFKWFSIADIDNSNSNGELFISPYGELSINGYWNSASKNMHLNEWHRVIYSVKLNEFVKIYLDGTLIKTISTGSSWIDGMYALRPELYLFKDDNSWNDRNNAYVSEIVMWKFPLNDMETEHLDEIKFR